jgi:hypothetical protein
MREGDKRRVLRPVIGPADDPMSLYHEMRRHLEWLLTRNYSVHSIRNKEAHLRQFITWCDERGVSRPQEVTRAILERYQRHLFLYRKKDGEPLSGYAQHQRLTPIKVWFRWLVASDASPARTLRRTLAKLARRWQRRFNEIAPEFAQGFADSAMGRADAAFESSLERSGFAVDFRLTHEANDAFQATIGENVGLIRSIAAEHLADVEGIVMRSVQTGQALGSLTDQLQERYAVTRNRAAFIARDQNSKATATVVRVRQEGLGITEAIWMHSHGGKHPRASHLRADGKRYAIGKGIFLDGVWTWPGREPNCRCVSRSVIPGLE